MIAPIMLLEVNWKASATVGSSMNKRTIGTMMMMNILLSKEGHQMPAEHTSDRQARCVLSCPEKSRVPLRLESGCFIIAHLLLLLYNSLQM